MADNPPNLGDLTLPALVNYLIDGLGRPSFDRIADLTRGPDGRPAIAATTLHSLAILTRHVGRVPEVGTLVGAAMALHTTPWALFHASGVSLEPLGLTGRPLDRDVAALSMLPTGWRDLPASDFAGWRDDGTARVAAHRAAGLQQQLDAAEQQLDAVQEQLVAARDKIAQLEAQLERSREPKPGRR